MVWCELEVSVVDYNKKWSAPRHTCSDATITQFMPLHFILLWYLHYYLLWYDVNWKYLLFIITKSEVRHVTRVVTLLSRKFMPLHFILLWYPLWYDVNWKYLLLITTKSEVRHVTCVVMLSGILCHFTSFCYHICITACCGMMWIGSICCWL